MRQLILGAENIAGDIMKSDAQTLQCINGLKTSLPARIARCADLIQFSVVTNRQRIRDIVLRQCRSLSFQRLRSRRTVMRSLSRSPGKYYRAQRDTAAHSILCLHV